jgi:hypothetical protein
MSHQSWRSLGSYWSCPQPALICSRCKYEVQSIGVRVSGVWQRSTTRRHLTVQSSRLEGTLLLCPTVTCKTDEATVASLIRFFLSAEVPSVTTSRSWGALSSMVYTKLKPDPAVFMNFTSLPSKFSTLRVSNLTDFANELSVYSSPGRRQLVVTGTYRNSAEMTKKIFDIANTTVRDLDKVEGIRVGPELLTSTLGASRKSRTRRR